MPNCFSQLISLKTVNEQRERKFGELFWLSNDWAHCWACAPPGRVHTISLLYDCCLSPDLHYCASTPSFAGPQRNWVFAFFPPLCSNASQTLFPCGLALIWGCMHISSTDTKEDKRRKGGPPLGACAPWRALEMALLLDASDSHT